MFVPISETRQIYDPKENIICSQHYHKIQKREFAITTFEMKLPSTILLLALFVLSTASAAENPLVRGSRELGAEGKPRKLKKPTTMGKPSKSAKDPANHPGKGCAGREDKEACVADSACCWKGENMKGNGYLCGDIGQDYCEEEPEEPEAP